MSRPPLTTVDALIADRHLLKHPFYRAWQDGTLSAEALRDYAAQYYRHVSAFPTYISALHSRCEDLETRQALLENLSDEEEGPENHPSLWRRFAEAVGCDEPGSGEAWPETVAAIAGFRSAVGEGPVVRGLAALYAYESMVPAVAAEKIRGLAEHYGVEGSPGTDYFEVHRTLDVEHAAASRELLERHVMSEADLAEAERGAAMALDTVNGLLDGICRVHGIRQAA
ncbi:MAG TPA: CADD family putative folate metabolism protein [Gemmatimonadota bacterium]|nr:CADD family putative folate metabolism protein [Gemmatimonadota bacterium]